jgi:hypothetical protein
MILIAEGEIACGKGRLSTFCTQRYGYLVGVDCIGPDTVTDIDQPPENPEYDIFCPVNGENSWVIVRGASDTL